MSFDQIRSSFDKSATLAEQAANFVSDRLKLVIQRQTPKPLMSLGPAAVIHFVPISAMSGRQPFNFREAAQKDWTQFIGDWGGASNTYNLDGMVAHPPVDLDGEYWGYCQIFRTGSLEATSLAGRFREEDATGIIFSGDLSKFFCLYARKFFHAARGWGFSGPAVMSFALINVDNFSLGINNLFGAPPKADRPHLIVPPIWIDYIESADSDELSRQLLDTLWQGFGQPRCLDFNESTGKFALRN